MSIASCDNCGHYIDTDYDVEGWIANGEAILCHMCRDDWPTVDNFLFDAIKRTEQAHYMSQQTDNSYANSGRWRMRMDRLRDLRQARIDLEKDAENGKA